MTKEEFLNKVYETIDYICNGKVERNGKLFNGHPHFFLLHTKQEFDDELLRIIPNKDKYDKYDFYYVLNHMFKYELNQYDSHTFASFANSTYLPIMLKVIGDKVYVINGIDNYSEYKGMEIKSINGVGIKKIIEELDFIKCYASNDFFNVQIEGSLSNADVIKSLPSIGNTDRIIFSSDDRTIDFDLKNLGDFSFDFKDDNYKTEIIDDTLVFSYLSCKDEEKMKNTVEYIKTLDGINHYVVDLRGNGGGDSSINRYLTDFLNGKDTIVLSDEKVFSSARMCLATLKRNGAFVIGKKPGTPISCFGNCVLKKDFDSLDIIVRGSVTYWYYDDKLYCHGITKENFDEVYKEHPEILNIVYGDVDIEVEPSLNDILDNRDSVLEYTLDYIKNKKTKTL